MARHATVVGSGPNGLAAAVTLARAGFDVRVLEAAHTVGGGLRTAALTERGFSHDVCSAVHPAALSSPFFRAFGLDRIDWIVPEASFAHPLDQAPAAIAWHDLERTAAALGRDGARWRALVRPLNRQVMALAEVTGDQLLRVPRHPLLAARFAARMLHTGTGLTEMMPTLRTPAAQALATGVFAHANTVLPSLAGSAAGLLLLAHAHSTGWALPRGGAQTIADTLTADLRAHGGTIETGVHVRDLTTLEWGDASAGDVLVLDTSARLLLTLPDLPPRFARAVARYRYGPAAAKVDVALNGPVPWRDPDVAAAPTVHLGGTRAEIEHAERTVAAGGVPERPYVLVVQPGVVDPTRAPAGHQTLWAYIHVPAGSDLDPTERVLAQLERFAPGVRERVEATHVMTAREREAYNPADVGGDILGGAFTLLQAVRRPVFSPTPWRTPVPGVYLGSAATPPGPGVNGMAGWHAARQVLRDGGDRIELDDLFG